MPEPRPADQTPDPDARPEVGESTAETAEPAVASGSDARTDAVTNASLTSDDTLPWRERLWTWMKPSRRHLSVAIAMCLVGMAIVMTVNSHPTRDRYASMRRDDMVELLDSLNTESQRLNAEIDELQRTRDRLQSGVDSQQIALEESERRRDGLEILAGTAPASGPGIRITISAPTGAITADLIVDAIQELRDAGAEVIEINDSIRVVAQTWARTEGQDLIVDGQVVTLPITIEAIGDSHALTEATRFRGGLAWQVESEKVGGSIDVKAVDQVHVTAVRTPPSLTHARPAG